MKKKIVIGLLTTVLIIAVIVVGGLYFIGDKIFEQLASSEEFSEDIVDDIELDGESESENQPVSGEELKNLNDNIPKIEKVKIAKTVLEKLNTDEINELKNIAQGGITYEEKYRVEEIIGNKFTEEEIKELKNTYEKYKN
jgi:hypothetical protein